jgi:ribose transport system substrate-binding protein
MIAQRVSAIVIAPADSKALVHVCKTAVDAGIVVINIDNKFDEDALKEKNVQIPFVGPDNRKGARLAGEYLAKKLKAGDKVAIVEGIPGAINGVERKLGFEAAMGAAGIEVVAKQTAYWETEKAEKVVSGMITQHRDLKGILCANDSMALGAVAALKAAGKLDDVLVVGYDNISAIQKNMLEGKVLCTVDQHADQIAVEGIRYALDILSGQATPKDKETPVDLITAQDLKKQAAPE